MKKLIIIIVATFVVIILSALCILPLEVHIIKDVAKLYNIDLLINLPTEFIFGALLIINILKISIKDSDLYKEPDYDDKNGFKAGLKSLYKLIIFVILLLLSWWVAYVVHSLNGL